MPSEVGVRVHPSGAKRQREPVTPLRVALACLYCTVFEAALEEYSTVFSSDISKLITAELYELHAQESTFDDLVHQVDALLGAEQTRNIAQEDKLSEKPEELKPLLEDFSVAFSEPARGCDFLQKLHSQVDSHYNGVYGNSHKPEQMAAMRSPLGIFIREMRLTMDLPFEGLVRLSKQTAQWMPCKKRSRLLPVERLNRRTAIRDTLETRMQALETHQVAAASGDYSQALASLLKFYDYRFPASGRGQHQHALLNLASYHYAAGGMEAALHAVEEAIKIARTEGDRECLQHCMSLMHRISMETSSPSSFPTQANLIRQLPYSLSKIPPLTTAKDELWSVRLALDLGESIPNAMSRVYRALGRHEAALQAVEDGDAVRGVRGAPLDPGSWHGTQAALWGCMGVESVTRLHEDLIDDESLDEDARLSAIASRAQRLASRGKLDEALVSLLSKKTVENMTMQLYQNWADTVWELVEQDARNRDDAETMQVVNALRSPRESIGRNGPGGPSRVRLEPSTSSDPSAGIKLAHEEVRSCLLKTRELRRKEAPAHLILPHALAAVNLASELGLWPLYRLASVLLADTLAPLDSAMAVREAGRVWMQVQQSDEKEALAVGAWVLGRAELEYALETDGSCVMARSYLEKAFAAAKAINLRSQQIDILALLALLPSDVSEEEAQGFADQWAALQDTTSDPAAVERARKIGGVVQLVGVRIVERWK